MFLVVRLWDAGDLFPTSSIYRPTTDFRLNSMCFHLALGDDSCRLPLRSNLQLGVHYIIPKDVGAGVYFSLEALPWRRCLISSNLLICKMAGLEEVGSSGSSFVGSWVGRENREMQVVLVFFDSGEMHSGKSWRWHLQVLLCHWCNLKLSVEIWDTHFSREVRTLLVSIWEQCTW